MNFLTYHTEVPVDQAFARGSPHNWLAPGVDPNTPIIPRPTQFPKHWIGSPAQRICGAPYKEPKNSPWLYRQLPNLSNAQALLGLSK